MNDVMVVMSNHYEGTAMAFDQDVGRAAGISGSPYTCRARARPLTWSYNDVSYHNERAVHSDTADRVEYYIAQIHSIGCASSHCFSFVVRGGW